MGKISIHASRGGSDFIGKGHNRARINFNPRFPRGKRLYSSGLQHSCPLFQSTLPAGEATIMECLGISEDSISIHASRGGSDLCSAPIVTWAKEFQSTLPAGEATTDDNQVHRASRTFQSTLPAGEATVLKWLTTLMPLISIHASRGGSDPHSPQASMVTEISIHASRGGSDPGWPW